MVVPSVELTVLMRSTLSRTDEPDDATDVVDHSPHVSAWPHSSNLSMSECHRTRCRKRRASVHGAFMALRDGNHKLPVAAPMREAIGRTDGDKRGTPSDKATELTPAVSHTDRLVTPNEGLVRAARPRAGHRAECVVSSWFATVDLSRTSVAGRRAFGQVANLLDQLQPARLDPSDQTVVFEEDET